VDECVRFRPLGRSRRQIIRTRPTNQELVDRPSKLEGVYNGVTKVERKADIDPLWHILPEEYARWWVDEAAGLDHLINRGPLVFKHESPEDIVPERKVLVCFVADAGGDELVRSKLKEEHPAPSTLGLALCYDMVWDAAERVPRREMALEMAVYQLQPGNAQPVRSSLFPLPLVPQRADNYRRLQVMDDTVPEFFYPRDEEGAGRSALDPDPYRFLERELAGAKWHSVYAVVVGAPERLGAILPSARVMLRQGFQHRDGLVLVSLDCRLRRHRAGSFRSFQEGAHAASRGGAYLLPSPEEDIRELFLDTIIGKPMPRRRPTVALTHAPGRPRAATR